MGTFATLPIWKKGTSAAEWLEELAGLARESPEKWVRIVVVLQEIDADGNPNKIRNYVRGIETNQDTIGTLQSTILSIWEYMNGRCP